MYSYIDPKIERLVSDFCCEAERLWAAERMSGQDSVTSIAAAQFIGLGYLGDHAILTYISDASEMGTRMGLFGGEDDQADETDDLGVFDDSQRVCRLGGIQLDYVRAYPLKTPECSFLTCRWRQVLCLSFIVSQAHFVRNFVLVWRYPNVDFPVRSAQKYHGLHLWTTWETLFRTSVSCGELCTG